MAGIGGFLGNLGQIAQGYQRQQMLANENAAMIANQQRQAQQFEMQKQQFAMQQQQQQYANMAQAGMLQSFAGPQQGGAGPGAIGGSIPSPQPQATPPTPPMQGQGQGGVAGVPGMAGGPSGPSMPPPQSQGAAVPPQQPSQQGGGQVGFDVAMRQIAQGINSNPATRDLPDQVKGMIFDKQMQFAIETGKVNREEAAARVKELHEQETERHNRAREEEMDKRDAATAARESRMASQFQASQDAADRRQQAYFAHQDQVAAGKASSGSDRAETGANELEQGRAVSKVGGLDTLSTRALEKRYEGVLTPAQVNKNVRMAAEYANSQKRLNQQESMVDTFANTALLNLKNVEGELDQMQKSKTVDIPATNKLLAAWKRATGVPYDQAIKLYGQESAAELSKLASSATAAGSGGTLTDREEWRAFFDPNGSYDQMKASLRAAYQSADNRKKANQDEMDALSAKIDALWPKAGGGKGNVTGGQEGGSGNNTPAPPPGFSIVE